MSNTKAITPERVAHIRAQTDMGCKVDPKCTRDLLQEIERLTALLPKSDARPNVGSGQVEPETWHGDMPGPGANSGLLMTVEDHNLVTADLKINADRYRKLQNWMASNVKEGWQEVERMGAICANMSLEDMDHYLDGLPECNVGLCETSTASQPETL
ncbi:hypothetical protein [Pseudomonas serbica]|uniref:hypothetical protein n=1 Tax=Pseudomonas serbica TaxID=2965074 RepID=UPI00237C2740|nr:hypothetical protein [Pseudomonas serbica]